MELALNIILAGASTMAGGVISWLASRHYYIKSRPAQTSVRALVSAAHKKLEKRGANKDTDKGPQISLQVVLELIEAFEKGDIYFPEMAVCARTYRMIGDLLNGAIRAADRAGEMASPTLSHQWFEARERALHEGLARAKQEVVQRLKH
jgi:hypothetical protein